MQLISINEVKEHGLCDTSEVESHYSALLEEFDSVEIFVCYLTGIFAVEASCGCDHLIEMFVNGSYVHTAHSEFPAYFHSLGSALAETLNKVYHESVLAAK